MIKQFEDVAIKLPAVAEVKSDNLKWSPRSLLIISCIIYNNNNNNNIR